MRMTGKEICAAIALRWNNMQSEVSSQARRKMSDEQIERIREELDQLSQKKLELLKENQKPLRLLQQSPDSELEAINSDEDRLNDIILAGAAVAAKPVPEKDWSKSLLYSHTLSKWNFKYPPDQLGLYVYTLVGLGVVSKAYWKSWNMKKGAEILESGVGTDMLPFHRNFTRLDNEGLRNSKLLRVAVKLQGFTVAGLLIGGFIGFVQLKNNA